MKPQEMFSLFVRCIGAVYATLLFVGAVDFIKALFSLSGPTFSVPALVGLLVQLGLSIWLIRYAHIVAQFAYRCSK